MDIQITLEKRHEDCCVYCKAECARQVHQTSGKLSVNIVNMMMNMMNMINMITLYNVRQEGIYHVKERLCIYMYILCLCTSASYEGMRRCSINLQRYAPPGKRAVSVKRKLEDQT